MVSQSSSSTPQLRRRSPSPKLPPDTNAPAYSHVACTKDGVQHPRCPTSSLWSSSSSPSFMQSPPSPSASLSQPLYSLASNPRPSLLHSNNGSSQNDNNNVASRPTSSVNNTRGVCNSGWSVFDGNNTEPPQNHYPLWSGSHNRVARPFSASEPSSRVQSPSPSPTPASFSHLCSPPPQHRYYPPLANTPPHPGRTRVGGSYNHLDLRLDLPRASSAGSAFGEFCLDGRSQIVSPPPIGVSVWTNNVETPHPRKSRYVSSAPFFSSASDSPTHKASSFSASASSSFLPGRSSLSRFCPLPSQNLSRTFSSSLENRPLSPAPSDQNGLCHSRADSRWRSGGLSGSLPASGNEQESRPVSPTSPSGEWSSHSRSLSRLSPRAGLWSGRFTSGKGISGGQHSTSVPWSGVQETSNKYIRTEDPETNVGPLIPAPRPPVPSLDLTTSSSPSDNQNDPELEEGNHRTQLICAYVARPSQQQNLSHSCLVFSSPPDLHQHQFQSPRPPQVTPPPLIPSVPAPSVPGSSPLPSTLSSPSKQGNQKTSYATTVNLQIAGSGRISSFSTAQVSLTQTLQGGAGPPEHMQMSRRVSVTGLPPVLQNCERL